VSALDRWAFAASDRYQLGIFRVLFVAWLARDYIVRILPRLVEHASRPPELLAPVSLVRWLGLPAQLPGSWLLATRVLAAVLLAAACAGVFTRAALVALALFNLWLGAAAASWGYTSHATALPALVLVVIACAPGVGACSVDAWLSSRKTPAPRTELVFGRAASIWPVRCVLLLLCLFYFASGYAKLRYAGLDWADGRTLAFYLEGGSRLGPNEPQRFFASEDAPPSARFRDGWGLEDYAYVARPTAFGRALGGSALASRALSVFTLFVELCFPLALLGRRVLFACLALGVAFHLGIEATLRIDFTSYLVVYLLFVDYKSLLHRFTPEMVRRLHRSY
jgi:hypothetical protein